MPSVPPGIRKTVSTIKGPSNGGSVHTKKGSHRLPFFFALVMPATLFALILVILFPVAPAVGASGGTPPEPCRDCGGVQYFSPMKKSEKAKTLDPRSGSGMTEKSKDEKQDGAPLSRQGRGQSEGTSGGPARLEREGSKRKHLSSDPRVRTARVLVKRNRFAEALKILRPLALEDRPDQTDVRFLLGLAASRGAQAPDLDDEERLALLDEAIATFRSILIRRPDLVRIRLELALAFYLKEDDQLAREHFERALVGKPPPALVANVVRFLSIMRARRRWRGYFGFSLAPDTNINAASDAQFIYINGLPFRRGAAGQASSGIGVVGWGGGEYQYPLAARWRLRAGFDLNHREYPGNQFDQSFVAGHVGPRWLISQNTEMSLLASTSQRWWGGSPFNYDVGARVEVLHRAFAGLLLNGQATWSDRKYQQQKFLEGSLMVFSLGANYVLLPTVQVNALAGYQQQEAQTRRWSNMGYWGRVGTNVALPFGFTIGLSAEFRWTDYESGWFPFVEDNSDRRDQTRILQATLLNRALTVYGFSPQAVFSNQVRTSNAQLFDYKRNLVEMRWVRQF